MSQKYESALRYEIFNKKEYSFLDTKIQNAKVIFDVGSHLGYFSEYCLMQNPELVIHCFEPQMVIWERSKKLLETQKNIFFKNAALWICDGEIDFYANEKKNMQSSLFANTWLNPYHRVQTIPCITIQSYLKEIKVSQIDLLKMDIEGAEFAIINDWDASIFEKISHLCIEYHILDESYPHKFLDMQSKLKKQYHQVEIIASPYGEKVGYLNCS